MGMEIHTTEIGSVSLPPEDTLPKKGWRRVLHSQYFWLCLLVIATLALHFATIMNPGEVVFDETYYVNDARAIIKGEETLRPEHPPVGKLFVVSGMLIFGDNPFGWRFFSVIFGTISIVLFYFICRKLMPGKATLLATFLFSLDNMGFVQASLALLDVYTVTFMLGGLLFYLHRGYLLSGMTIALSALAKLTGGLAFIAIILHWLFARKDKPKWFVASIVVTAISFLVFMFALDYVAFWRFVNPIQRTLDMLNAGTSITFEYAKHPYMSRPWDWILLPKIMPYWWDPQYISFVSFTIWALIIPAVIYMFYRARKGNNAASFGLAWFAATFLIWIPISFATNRVSFIYYFYPTVGAICIGIGLGLSHLLDIIKTKSARHRRAVMVGIVIYLVFHAVIFIVVNPAFKPLIKFYEFLQSSTSTS